MLCLCRLCWHWVVAAAVCVEARRAYCVLGIRKCCRVVVGLRFSLPLALSRPPLDHSHSRVLPLPRTRPSFIHARGAAGPCVCICFTLTCTRSLPCHGSVTNDRLSHHIHSRTNQLFTALNPQLITLPVCQCVCVCVCMCACHTHTFTRERTQYSLPVTIAARLLLLLLL